MRSGNASRKNCASRRGKRNKAIEHLDFAITEFQAIEMQPALERRGLLKA